MPLLVFSAELYAPPIGFSGSPYPPGSGTVSRSRTGGSAPVVVSPPFMYDPDHDLYDWKIGKDEGSSDNTCYYDAYYGQYFGNCLLYQNAPGYSITVPSQIRR
ncbi:MAG TPA: hypothetical protein VFW62_07645 [bacterium]|nr:hypothetical protein [bacterium]